METLFAYLPGIFIAYGILLVGACSPGRAIAMLMGISIDQGRRSALIACTGIACGSATTNVLTLLGVGLVLSQVGWSMILLKYLGAGYLIYLACGAFKKALAPPKIALAAQRPQSGAALFANAYLLQATNPKSIAFWLAIASIGTTAGAPHGVIFFFVLSCAVLSFVCHAAWALVLSANPLRAAYQRVRRYVEGALGAFFGFAAIKLALART
ncbi:MAG: LysE family translocator [Pseudomonadota bacterium]